MVQRICLVAGQSQSRFQNSFFLSRKWYREFVLWQVSHSLDFKILFFSVENGTENLLIWHKQVIFIPQFSGFPILNFGRTLLRLYQKWVVPHTRGCAGCRIGTRFLHPTGTSPLKGVNLTGTPGYRNGTESLFGLKGRPLVVRDVQIHNQPVFRMKRK